MLWGDFHAQDIIKSCNKQITLNSEREKKEHLLLESQIKYENQSSESRACPAFWETHPSQKEQWTVFSTVLSWSK